MGTEIIASRRSRASPRESENIPRTRGRSAPPLAAERRRRDARQPRRSKRSVATAAAKRIARGRYYNWGGLFFGGTWRHHAARGHGTPKASAASRGSAEVGWSWLGLSLARIIQQARRVAVDSPKFGRGWLVLAWIVLGPTFVRDSLVCLA